MLFIDLGLWDVQICTENQEIIQALCKLFGTRASKSQNKENKLLTCNVIEDKERYEKIASDTVFDGPVNQIRPGVLAVFSLQEDITRIKQEHTAIIELTEQDPYSCTVYLEPISPDKKVKPLPESFIYVVLIEWLRNVGAYLFHCGAVALHGKAVVLTGPPGSGKSTHIIRMLQQGADFLADDLAILYKKDDEIQVRALREVADLGEETLKRFPELQMLSELPIRGNEKFQVDIKEQFNKNTLSYALPGVILHLYPDQEVWIRNTPEQRVLEGVHQMNWFRSRPEQTQENFFVLSELALDSLHLDVSQGYLSAKLDELMAKLDIFLKTDTMVDFEE